MAALKPIIRVDSYTILATAQMAGDSYVDFATTPAYLFLVANGRIPALNVTHQQVTIARTTPGSSMPADFEKSASPAPAQPAHERADRRCLHLGPRVEFRPGCTGWTCRHDCARGFPAVPGESCQACPDFEDDGRF